MATRSRTVLVAIDTKPTDHPHESQRMIEQALEGTHLDPNHPFSTVESWHFAEDDAIDSGHASWPAVFCRPGKQRLVRDLLRIAGLA